MSAISIPSRASGKRVRPASSLVDAAAHQVDAPLAAHFSHLRQQYDASKLGMWLFLATEVMLFAGLFCVYAVFRCRHPEVFDWGRRLLDVRLGLTNTTVLLLSSLTMALAVNCVQRRRRWEAVVLLGLTFLGGAVFMAIKSVEYEQKLLHNLLPTAAFYSVSERPAGLTALAPGDAATGIRIWNATCRACHGAAGEGIAGQGKDVRQSQFIQDRSDAELLAFINVGRPITDPANTTKLAMPAKGGNPFLSDQDLMHVIAYLRSFQVPIHPPEATGTSTTSAPAAASSGAAESLRASRADESASSGASAPTSQPGQPASTMLAEQDLVPRWVVPPPPLGSPGLILSALASTTVIGRAVPAGEQGDSEKRPAGGHLFFGIYFLMTGLHGLHVLAGMGVVAWLMFRSMWQDFGPTYFTPVDLGGLYWHLVDIVWLFLFPLFYLA